MSALLDPRITILGNSSIGLFGLATDSYTLLPYNIKENTLQIIENHLQTDLIVSSVANAHLNGLFAVGNSKHLLLPHLISEDELNSIENQINSDISIHIMKSKITALGNTIVCNDKKAIVHKDFSKDAIKRIGDYLDVEVISKTFMDSALLGSMIFLSSRGFLTHPLFSDEELDWVTNYFSLDGNLSTVNRGTPYPRLGILANKNGVLVGSDTTGPEILRIMEILK